MVPHPQISGGSLYRSGLCSRRELFCDRARGTKTERDGTTMLIPLIFPFLPTYLVCNNFALGELKIGRSLEWNCLSSLPGVSNTPARCYRGSATFF